MRLARFNDDRLGLVDGDALVDVTAALDALPIDHWPLMPGDPLIRHLGLLQRPIRAAAEAGRRLPLADVSLHSPIATPTKILAAPVNYKKHLDEARADPDIHHGAQIKTIDDLGLFLKNSTALAGPDDGVTLTWTDRRIDHEVELAVVIGKEGYRVSRADAMEMVAAYAIGLDMTVRGTEDRSFRKSFDSFAVLGPWLVTADEIPDPNNLDFWIKVNGEERQKSNTGLLIWDIPKLIEYATSAYTLYPGDIIMTGTPEGVAPVAPGDVMECWIDGIGAMTVPVREG